MTSAKSFVFLLSHSTASETILTADLLGRTEAYNLPTFASWPDESDRFDCFGLVSYCEGSLNPQGCGDSMRSSKATAFVSVGRHILRVRHGPPAGKASSSHNPLYPQFGTQSSTQYRQYRGEAGDESSGQLSHDEQALVKIAQPKYDAILKEHLRLPNLDDIPESSLTSTDTELDIRRKRLVYRSKQRGWLEVDLLLGTWASDFVPQLSQQQLDDYEEFVNQETIDIYNIVCLRVEATTEMGKRIQEWAKSSPLGKADPATYERVKTDSNLI